MGQQQLLLIILVTIIVGIATVVAINTFSSAADNANLDAVRQDLTQMAADAQGYYMKPDMMDGGGNAYDGITFENINCPGDVTDGSDEGDDGIVCENENGDYEITTRSGEELVIQGTPSSDDSITLEISNVSGDNAEDFDIEETTGT